MYVKTESHPDLPPPVFEAGVVGWLKKNLFATWQGSCMTLIALAFLYKIIPPFINWVVINAVWAGSERCDCDVLSTMDNPGACWVFIKVRLGMFFYGFYPVIERWRINFAFFLMIMGILPLFLNSFFALDTRLRHRIFLATGSAGTLASLIYFGTIPGAMAALLLFLPLVLTGSNRTGIFAASLEKRTVLLLLFVYPVVVYTLFTGGPFGLEPVPTHLWGGMFLTLVVAGVGIIFSFPIGILLALGRRSELPVIRSICIYFIEFVRGVPLISVLFMASVMLPLFLPEGVHFNKLLRALIGVALFYAAYMAEVIRGGLQSIPSGQTEAANALGFGYWKRMRLIVLPQAIRLVIPGITNTFLGLLKDTTLVAVIGLMDMLGIVKTALADTEWLGFTKEAYVFAGFSFWILCFAISRYSMFLERRLKKQG